MRASNEIRRSRADPRRLFRFQAVLGVAGMSAASAAVATTVLSVQHAPRDSGRIVVAGLRFSYPTLNPAAAVLLVLAALGVIVLTAALRACVRQRSAYRSFLRKIHVLGSLDGRHGAKVIEGSAPQAFCAGYLRPAVYVSQRTVEMLGEDELEAVLAHEHHHLRARDPLRIAIASALSQALFFLPILRPLADRYGQLAEVTADEAAIRASRGRRGPLASALLAFEDSGPSHAAGISNERVDCLLGQPERWRLPSSTMAVSILALVTFATVMWRAGEAASAHASLNLPVLSAQPCIALLTLIALVAVRRLLGRRRLGRRRLAVAL